MVTEHTAHYPDYPFANHYLNVNGHALHYLDEGPRSAPAVVMLHGNPSWSFYYRKLVSALRGDRRCIVPDHIGMGLSAKPAKRDYPFTLARRVDDLDTLLTHLDTGNRMTLVMHDWGGMIGMAYALRYPQRIARLVISNSAAFHPPRDDRLPWQLGIARAPLFGRLLTQGVNLFVRGAARYCVTRPLTAVVSAAYLAPYDSWAHRLAVHEFVADIPLRRDSETWRLVDAVDRELARLNDVPMLICWGLRDFVFGERFLAEWVARFPAATVHRFDDAGHYLLEDAGEQVIPLIAAFLQKDRPT